MTEKIALFAGTTEGKALAASLAGTKVRCDVFAATDYGCEGLPEAENIRVFAGRLDRDEMDERFASSGYSLILDATHPFAQIVTENIREAAKKNAIPLIRVLRQRTAGYDGVILVHSIDEAVMFLKGTEGNIFAATGSKELARFKEIPDWETRVYARVLSLPQVVKDCSDLGFYGAHLIAMQGPFSEELNYALLKSTGARWMVTKESGKAGGFEEKIEAAKRAGAGLIVIGRPDEEGMSVEETLRYLAEKFGVKSNRPGAGSEELDGEKRTVYLIGAGPGNPGFLTKAAEETVSSSDLIVGAARVADLFCGYGIPVFKEYRPEEIIKYLREHPEYKKIAAVFSGDSGFYSGAKKLYSRLSEEKDFNVSVLPGISSMNYFFSKLGKSWEDACFLSLHGRCADWVSAVKEKRTVFLLTGGGDVLKTVCGGLLKAGLSGVTVTVGENLSLPGEKIFSGSPEELKDINVAPLSVLLIENPQAGCEILTHGLPDDALIRGDVPMTKMEVRTISIAKLGLRKNSIVYDVGAGTGSVSVECARVSSSIRVYAIERKAEAVELIHDNAEKFGLGNIEIIPGEAPEAIHDLPAPTHVFIGGSGGKLAEIIETCLKKNPSARFVVNAIAIESLGSLSAYLKHAPVKDVEYVELFAARSKQAGSSHLMMGQNPVYIVSFTGNA